VFGMIPGLENASYARYGVMHRNTFLSSPGFLNAHFEMINRPRCYFAGQMTGVEGYVESAASGLLCGLSLGRDLLGLGTVEFPGITAMGAMGRYISTPNKNFQPMNCSFGLIDGLVVDKQHKKIRNKQQGSLVGNMASMGTTPRRIVDLLGSLCDLTSGSGDKGTPIIYIQGYFDNFIDE
jgi:methylenetetrahydrofolate--tRNA-(uracil-5-)-methyltransferase